MITINKKVGTMALQMTITNQANGTSIHGEIHPFIDRFHCVKFSLREQADHYNAQVGCGSSGMNLDEAARMADAFAVANDLARYYKEIGESLLKRAGHERNYVFLLQRLFDTDDVESLAEVFMMTPKNITGANVVEALKMLDKRPILPGMQESVRDTLADDFFSLPNTTVEAIGALLDHHPDFEVKDKDFVGSAVAFLDQILSNEVSA